VFAHEQTEEWCVLQRMFGAPSSAPDGREPDADARVFVGDQAA
jgi:hypothetical protein